MIKLNRPSKPKELEDNEQQLTDEYLISCNKVEKGEIKYKKRVWDKDYIRTPLHKMSYGKCAYCETRSGSLEIEHFLCRSKHAELVVRWTNLLLACHECNNKWKHEIDCEKEPIIDPSKENPKDYLVFKELLFMPRDRFNKIAYNTIEIFQYNTRDDLTMTYFIIRKDINQKINQYYIDAGNINKNNEIFKNTLGAKIEALLKLAQKDHAYSAVYATIILKHTVYEDLITKLKSNKIWNEDSMGQLDRNMREIALI